MPIHSRYIVVFLLSCTVSASASTTRSEVIDSFLTIARKYIAHADFSEAESILIRTKIAVSKDTTSLMTTYTLLAQLYHDMDSDHIALDYITQAEMLSDKSSNDALAKLCAIAGEIYLDRDDVEVAQRYWHKALSLSTTSASPFSLAVACKNLARYHNNAITKDSALYYAEKAYEIMKTHPSSVDTITQSEILSELGYARKIQVGYDDSITYITTYDTVRQLYREAIRLLNLRYKKPTLALANMYLLLGNSYHDVIFFWNHHGNASEVPITARLADSNYEIAVNLLKKLTGENGKRMSDVYFVRGLMNTYLTDFQKAISYYNLSLLSLIGVADAEGISMRLTENRILDLPSLMFLLHYRAETHLSIYKQKGEVQHLMAAYDDYNVGLQTWETIIEKYQSENPNTILNTYSILPFERGISTAYKLWLLTGDNRYKEKVFEYSEKSKYSILLKNILTASPSDTRQAFDRVQISPELVQANLLTDSSAIIEYAFASERSGANSVVITFITKDRHLVYQTKASADSIVNSIRMLRQAISKNDILQYSTTGFWLYQSLLDPLLKDNSPDIKKLILIPEGAIALIPFDALLIEQPVAGNRDYRNLNYLIEKYTTSLALSCRILTRPGQSDSHLVGEILGFAPNQFDDGLGQLPFNSKCLRKMSEKFTGKFFFDDDATTANFIDNAGDYSIIHIATHNIADESEPLNSKLYFQHGSLTPAVIYSQKLKAQLTVLTSCETAVGRFERGEGMMSMARAFMYAGCPATISTLWQVDDEASATLMENFYHNLADGIGKDEALHQSKIQFLKQAQSSQDANPFYWAGITLIGDASPVKLSEKHGASRWMIVAIILGAVIFGGVVVKKRIRS